MTNNPTLPPNPEYDPFRESQRPTVNIPRIVDLRMEMIDPDNQKVGARAVIDEQTLITADDPRELLFYYLQKMARKMIEEAFPTKPMTEEEQRETDRLLRLANATNAELREAENEAIADLMKNPRIREAFSEKEKKDDQR